MLNVVLLSTKHIVKHKFNNILYPIERSTFPNWITLSNKWRDWCQVHSLLWNIVIWMVHATFAPIRFYRQPQRNTAKKKNKRKGNGKRESEQIIKHNWMSIKSLSRSVHRPKWLGESDSNMDKRWTATTTRKDAVK